jgi:glycosyltransferase 2 family protein
MKRWLLTALSFAAVIGVSAYTILDWSGQGRTLSLPWRAHALAALAVITDIVSRSWKVSWSARAMGIRISFSTALRTTMAGDFGASITPARSGSEPARFLVLAEAGVSASKALVVLFAELFLEALSLATIVIIVAILFHDAGVVLGALIGVVGGYAAFVIGVAAVALMLSRRNIGDEPPNWARRLRLSGDRWLLVQRWFANVRTTVEHVRGVDTRWAVASYFASVVHVGVRLVVLPALVLTAAPNTPLAPLTLWPLGFLYGVAIVPAPGGGGAVEIAFRAALGGVIPAHIFPASLLWWRFYTFYSYMLLGALAAGRTAMRAVRKTEEMEEELEHADSRTRR